MIGSINRVVLSAIMLAVGSLVLGTSSSFAEDEFLDEAVDFTATILYLESGVPSVLLGAIRNGETAVTGIGDADGNGNAPDADTILRIGSISKVFTGQVFASMVADGEINFTDRLQDRLGWDVTVPSRSGNQIRLIDLATHTSGLPREIASERPSDPSDEAAVQQAYIEELNRDHLLFTPGTGALYSNFAYDLLGAALANTAGTNYDSLLTERVLDPLGLTDTYVFLPDSERHRLMIGHNFDGRPLADQPSSLLVAGSGSLYSTANDILRFLEWHLDRFAEDGAEVRMLDHAAYVQRDVLAPVYGLDESGEMDALGLGWVFMMPEGNRPLLLQKAGGFQGVFVYCAFAPSSGVAAFVAINEYDFATAMNMATVVNDLIAAIAPR